MWMDFGRLVQNDMPVTMNRSKSEAEVEFQYGGRLFFEIGSTQYLSHESEIHVSHRNLVCKWSSAFLNECHQ